MRARAAACHDARMISRWHDWVASGRNLRLFSHDIFVRAAGTGSPLLFLHGFPTSSFDFAAIAPALEAKHRCIYFDFLGFGASDKPALHYDYELQTNIAIAVAQAHGLERATVVAHDYGVTVGQELLAREAEGRVPFALDAMVFLNGGLCAALHRPILVQKLFASAAGPLAARLLTSKRMFARSMREIIRRMDRFDVDEHYQTITPRRMPALLGYIAERKRKHERYEGALRDTAVPLAFAWGLEDPVSGAHALAWARAAAPRAQVTALAGVGHYPQLEAPEQVVAAIEAAG